MTTNCVSVACRRSNPPGLVWSSPPLKDTNCAPSLSSKLYTVSLCEHVCQSLPHRLVQGKKKECMWKLNSRGRTGCVLSQGINISSGRIFQPAEARWEHFSKNHAWPGHRQHCYLKLCKHDPITGAGYFWGEWVARFGELRSFAGITSSPVDPLSSWKKRKRGLTPQAGAEELHLLTIHQCHTVLRQCRR